MNHCILLLQHLPNHMHFITPGYKRFSKTNLTDPRQRVKCYWDRLRALHNIRDVTPYVVNVDSVSVSILVGQPMVSL